MQAAKTEKQELSDKQKIVNKIVWLQSQAKGVHNKCGKMPSVQGKLKKAMQQLNLAENIAETYPDA